MGDTIELTTHSRNATSLFKVTTYLQIEIKGGGNAAIGLTDNPAQGIKFWIVLGDHNLTSYVKHVGGHKKTVHTPHLLSNDHYHRFLIQWGHKRLDIRDREESDSLMLSVDCKVLLSYFTVCSFSSRNRVYWRFELPPPKIPTPPLVHLDMGGPVWIPHKPKTPLPADAVIGGHDETGYLYIIRAKHEASLTPGKYAPDSAHGFISWDMRDHMKTDFEVLTGLNCSWLPAKGATIPSGAMVAGHSEVNREVLYVGRAQVQGHVIPGKVQPSHGCCYVAYDGLEVARSDYEVLVSPEQADTGLAINADAGSDSEW